MSPIVCAASKRCEPVVAHMSLSIFLAHLRVFSADGLPEVITVCSPDALPDHASRLIQSTIVGQSSAGLVELRTGPNKPVLGGMFRDR